MGLGPEIEGAKSPEIFEGGTETSLLGSLPGLRLQARQEGGTWIWEPDPDPLQVTGVGLWEGAGISLAKIIQTEVEPDPRETARCAGAPRRLLGRSKARGREQGETLREGLERLSPVGAWELFPCVSFRSCSGSAPLVLELFCWGQFLS